METCSNSNKKKRCIGLDEIRSISKKIRNDSITDAANGLMDLSESQKKESVFIKNRILFLTLDDFLIPICDNNKEQATIGWKNNHYYINCLSDRETRKNFIELLLSYERHFESINDHPCELFPKKYLTMDNSGGYRFFVQISLTFPPSTNAETKKRTICQIVQEAQKFVAFESSGNDCNWKHMKHRPIIHLWKDSNSDGILDLRWPKVVFHGIRALDNIRESASKLFQQLIQTNQAFRTSIKLIDDFDKEGVRIPSMFAKKWVKELFLVVRNNGDDDSFEGFRVDKSFIKKSSLSDILIVAPQLIVVKNE